MDKMINKRIDLTFLITDLEGKSKSIGTDKGLAKIGDGVVNLTYSVAKSIFLTHFKNSQENPIREGKKVDKFILSNALKNAEMRKYAKTRPDSHDLANTYESLIAYVWLSGAITINEIIQILENQFEDDISNYKLEKNNAIKAFTILLNHIKQYIPKIE
jgi:hypothetical protein